MSSTSKFAGVITLIFTLLFPALVAAEQIIFVDFKNARLLHYYGDPGREPDIYPIVLPKLGVQAQMGLTHPVHGTLTQVDYKPTWWPTPNMRRAKPSLPAAIKYGEAGHPIGVYRLRILWSNPSDAAFWQWIRIHGGAQLVDLGNGESSGCIRMLDADITRMVQNINAFGGDVRVTFMPAQFLS